MLDAVPAEAPRFAREFVQRWPSHRIDVLALDNVQACDDASAIALRLLVPRVVQRGAIVVCGADASRPCEFTDALERLADADAGGSVVRAGELTAAEVNALVRERAGVGVASSIAERARRLTGGRLGAVNAYLAECSAQELRDLAAVRVLHERSNARMPGVPRVDVGVLGASARMAAETIAAAGECVSMAVVQLAAARVGIDVRPAEVTDGGAVLTDARTGLLHLCDPLTADEIRSRTPAARRRAVHAVLAESTYGATAWLHRVAAQERMTAAFADRVLVEAAALERRGAGADAVDLLDALGRRTAGTSLERRALEAFGLACVRQLRGVDFQSRLPELTAAAPRSRVLQYVYAVLRTMRAHGRLEARSLRQSYVAASPQDHEHLLMQADVALFEFLSAMQTGGEAVAAAADEATRVLTEARDRGSPPAEFAWLDPEARLVFVEALSTAGATVHGHLPPDAARTAALEIATRTRRVPASMPQRVDALTVAAGVLALVHDAEGGAVLALEAAELHATLTRPVLAPGALHELVVLAAIHRGDWDQARERALAAAAGSGDGFDMPARIALPALASWLSAVSGDLESSAQFLRIAERSDRYRYAAAATEQCTWAGVELLRHRDGAAEALELLLERLGDAPTRNSPRIAALQADLCAELGDTERGAEALARWRALVATRAWSGANAGGGDGFAWLEGALAAANGDAERSLAAFASALATVASPFERGRCELGRATVLAGQRGGQIEAIEGCARAVAAFASIGAESYVRKACRVQQSIVDDIRARVASLSARERQVVVLAAQRWTNREIAAELRVSAATVAFHMSNALHKTALERRSQLAALLRAADGDAEASTCEPTEG